MTVLEHYIDAHSHVWTPDIARYPLAPEHTYRDVFPALLDVYRDLIARIDPGKLILLGDSAGAGMALALAQSLKATGLLQPRDLVLFSPWLDLTMSDPAAGEIDDPILAPFGLIAAGKMYAGKDDPATPLCSPINGDLSGLPRTTVFIGTRDVFLPDCRCLHLKMKAAGTPINHLEYAGLFHCWPLCPLPETTQAMKQLAEIVAD